MHDIAVVLPHWDALYVHTAAERMEEELKLRLQ